MEMCSDEDADFDSFAHSQLEQNFTQPPQEDGQVQDLPHPPTSLRHPLVALAVAGVHAG